MSNAYDSTRGNTTDRQRRKLWLIETYAADQALVTVDRWNAPHVIPVTAIKVYEDAGDTVHRCCRCYRCGKLLTLETMTVDRIIPGCKGGTYRRSNIRPSCSDCANKQGAELSAESRNQVPVVRPRVRQLAARDAQAGRGDQGTVPVPDVQAPGAGSVRRNGKVA